MPLQAQNQDKEVVDQDKEVLLFVAIVFASSEVSKIWLNDSGWTNQMTIVRELFKRFKSNQHH